MIWHDLQRGSRTEAEAPRPTGYLLVVEGGGTSFRPGHSFSVHGTATIGRSSDNSVVLADGFVSTNHAVLTRRDAGWWLTDLGSRNGTWVNEDRIEGEVQVAPGDLITLGQVKLKLTQ